MANEREAGVDRIIAFSDGVVAIAITLLVLPLTEIDRSADATLAAVVVDNQAALFAFALSFAVIANYWAIHHAILQPLRRHNRRLIQLNMLWLAAIVFLPFPTALIADGLEGGFSTLYISTLLLVSILNLSSPITSRITPNSLTAKRPLIAVNMPLQVASVLPHSWSP
jgi:uncharacterized membrane protein